LTHKRVPSYEPQLPPERELERDKTCHITHQLSMVGFYISRKGEEFIATCWLPNVCHMLLVTSDYKKIMHFEREHLKH
jgi:hypothetical protein